MNFNNKTIILTIQPYVIDEESEYKIYYAKNGTIPTNMDRCEAIDWANKNITDENIHIKSFTHNATSVNYYAFEAQLDFSMDIWTNNEINYDIIVYSKQSENEQFINACTLNIKKINK